MAFSVASILGGSRGTDTNKNADSPSPLPRSRQRRSRTIFSDAALDRLEAVFSENPYPDINLREQLAQEAGVTEARIQVWFQNRRSRRRRTKTKPVPSTSSRRDSGFVSASPSPQKLSPPSKTSPPTPARSPYSYGYPMAYPYLFGCSPLVSPPAMYPMMHRYPEVTGMLPSSPLFSPGVSPTFQRFFDFPMNSMKIPDTTYLPTSALPTPYTPKPGPFSSLAPVVSCSVVCKSETSSERSNSPVLEEEEEIDVTSGASSV